MKRLYKMLPDEWKKTNTSQLIIYMVVVGVVGLSILIGQIVALVTGRDWMNNPAVNIGASLIIVVCVWYVLAVVSILVERGK